MDLPTDRKAFSRQAITLVAACSLSFLLGTQFELMHKSIYDFSDSNTPQVQAAASVPAQVDKIEPLEDTQDQGLNLFQKAATSLWDNFASKVQQDPRTAPPPPDLNQWNRGDGGLFDGDRRLLFDIYGRATSVFEYGLGESTRIANAVGVPRYAGIDSDAVWVTGTARNVSDHFRFYLADIGPTKLWGFPLRNLEKNAYNYQMAPLAAERDPFDVYMVDGRYRFACMMASFLHASSLGANKTETTVMVHDCFRRGYHLGDKHLVLVQKSDQLCVYKRRPDTTDETLYQLWDQNKLVID